MGIAAAIGAGGSALLGAAATVYAGEEQGRAQRAAASANLQGVRGTNRANLGMYLASRGAPIQFNANGAPIIPSSVSGASSALYPYYMSGAEGTAGNNASLLNAALTGAPVSSLNLTNPGYASVNLSAKDIRKLQKQQKNLQGLNKPSKDQAQKLTDISAKLSNLKMSPDGQGAGTYYVDNAGSVVPVSRATVSGTNPWTDKLSGYQSIMDRFAPDAASAERTASDLVSGRMTQDMLGEAAPVWSSRVSGATAQRNAGLQALSKTLNDIDAIQARRGFAGDTLGNRLTKFAATSGIYSQGAANMNAAILQNALEKQGIQQTGRGLQISNLSLPDTMAAAAVGRKQAPANAAVSELGTSLAPLNNFRIGNTGTTVAPPPNQTPVPTGGQLIGQGLAALGSAGTQYLSNYANNQQLINGLKSLNNQNQTPTSVNLPAGTSFGGPNQGTPETAGNPGPLP